MDKLDSDDKNEENTENRNVSKTRGKKRKRKGSNSSSESEDEFPENTLEVEQNLIASAVKNNLDEISVKKILKKVVTNDHVLALVKLREEEEESRIEQSGVRPKLTRAKVKELMKVSPKTAPWNLENIELTPIKHIPVKTRPEVKALIAQELPEDEDDEEYNPTNDDVPSDDDQGLESCSDIDSQPRTPATPRSVSRCSPKVVKDGPFIVPQEISTPTRRKLTLDEEEATIALRTRSKLCLSETPIEHIESSFVPPDELPVPVDDHLWNDFLNECLNPASVTRNEDDDETDPEYNVAADPDANDEDEEALENTMIKISQKELSDLVTELFSIIPETTVDDELTNMANSVLTDHSHIETNISWEGKQEPLSDEERPLKICERSVEGRNSVHQYSIGKSEPMDEDPLACEDTETVNDKPSEQCEKNEHKERLIVTTPCNVVRIAVEEKVMGVRPLPTPQDIPSVLQIHPEPVAVRVTLNPQPVVLPEQVQILQQQLRQHIQIATSNFLQLFVNPLHWALAPIYKEYLESLMKMVKTNPSSVVDVCNLRPALELVEQWEQTVANDTPENTEMVEYIQREAERWRRRTANNKLYVGEFHETFKKVVANSPVFLYPYLLPPMPYGADSRRRYNYLLSEDELIAIGLDQFWQYVEDNPDLYRQPGRSHPRHRWGLLATVELVVKHMLPWQQPRAVMQHVMTIRRQQDKDNPIYKFFVNREVTPVKHKLLPFNPKITLYEQPEHEMPRCWLKYLSKTSKRFKVFLQRRQNVLGQTPTGVDIKVGAPVELPTKEPLPIAFTKEIKAPRLNSTIKNKPVLADKFDVDIEKEKQPPLNFYQLVATSGGHALVPLVVQTVANTSTITLVPKTTPENGNLEINQLITKSNVLTNTVNCNITPISSTIEVKNASKPNVIINEAKTKVNEEYHCSCCNLLRETCKPKQTVITDFFSVKNKHANKISCQCIENRYPVITKRLKLLISRYKSNAKCVFDDIQKKLKIRKSENDEISDKLELKPESYTVEDLAFVTAFQLKLITRASVARNVSIKSRVNNLFSKFDLDWGDPIKLSLELDQIFNVEMLDMAKEFIGFLNADQAEKINRFKDYFIQNCASDLAQKIEEEVKNEDTKMKLLKQISTFFTSHQWSPCSMCSSLLFLLRAYPDLARYTFALFPHATRHENCDNALSKPVTLSEDVNQNKAKMATPEFVSVTEKSVMTDAENNEAQISADKVAHSNADSETQNDVDFEQQADPDEEQATYYEADHSSSDGSGEESGINHTIEKSKRQSEVTTAVVKTETPVSTVDEIPGVMSSNIEIHEYSESDMSLTIISEQENMKSEPLEWKREEDKLILEILKQHLTPEERQEKTIIEIIEDKQIVQILTESLPDKSFHDVKERVLNILKLLVIGEV